MSSVGRRLAWLFCLAGMPVNALAADKPHIVVFLADDLGNADLGYRGSPIRTPHLDALAMSGARLESYYGQPACTPARAALLTGRYPMRHGLQTVVIYYHHTYGLPTDEKTLPQALKEVGYRTYLVGKWHLGHADRKYWPNQRGFDHTYGNLVGEVDHFTKVDNGGKRDWWRNGQPVAEEGFYTTQIGDEAVKLIERHDPNTPMFLYFASYAPHYPYQAPPELAAAYRTQFADEAKRNYAAQITAFDAQVGRVLAALAQKGMRDDTLIFFASDNGGPAPPLAKNAPAANAPFSGGKMTQKEGGLRVPAFVNWPKRIKPCVVREPLHHVDVMPTLLALAGAAGDPAKPFDGKDAFGTIAEGRPSPHEDILLNVEAFRGAIRKGRWKLDKVALLPGSTALFDVVADPSETNDLAAKHPDIVKDLESRLVAYARQQKMSELLKLQLANLEFTGPTVFDPR